MNADKEVSEQLTEPLTNKLQRKMEKLSRMQSVKYIPDSFFALRLSNTKDDRICNTIVLSLHFQRGDCRINPAIQYEYPCQYKWIDERWQQDKTPPHS